MNDYREEGFDDLEKHGFVSEYIEINHKDKVMRPAFLAENLLAQGWPSAGAKVRFLGENGYECERNQAKETFQPDQILTIKLTHISGTSSSYEFEEVSGRWNTVMFEKSGENRESGLDIST